jgi:hypothetical protein
MPKRAQPARTAGNTRGPDWKGPPGLSRREKKNWSEKQRRESWSKEKRATENAARADRAAVSDRNPDRDRRREKSFRFRSAIPRELTPATHSTITERELRRPALNFMDTNGRIHREENLSAEELIARFLAREKKRKKT